MSSLDHGQECTWSRNKDADTISAPHSLGLGEWEWGHLFFQKPDLAQDACSGNPTAWDSLSLGTTKPS